MTLLYYITLLSFVSMVTSFNSLRVVTQYTANALNDQIIDLPGLNEELSFNQFSGYLNLPNTKKQIHYWLVESESDPANDPIVFWTNGGPGCSGLIGFMTEQGPFRPDQDGNLNINPWRWNKIANMVFFRATCRSRLFLF
jgi:cathepsin A (carboxypeptidase C)